MAQKAVKPLGLSKNKGIFRRELPFYLMLIPGVLFALVFSYGPMFGLVMAFQDFTPLKSFENSPWVGLQNFRDMLALPTFWSVVRNTLVISLSKIVLRLLVPLVIALLLNEVINEKFKRVAQSVFFLPYFLSWAVMGGILRSLFQYDGMVNSVLTSLGMERIMFLGSNTWFPIIVILSDVWKDMGYNMIIFLAAITNVDPALNESAALDGANRWQQIWNITLPTIRPIVVMLLVLSLGCWGRCCFDSCGFLLVFGFADFSYQCRTFFGRGTGNGCDLGGGWLDEIGHIVYFGGVVIPRGNKAL